MVMMAVMPTWKRFPSRRPSKGLYQQKPGHMCDNVALYDWAGDGQDTLHIVHEHFLHYLIYT
jgi:hypothetical protein